MENDNQQKQVPYGEIDRFSRLIFGRGIYKEGENNSQELPKQKEQSSFDRRTNRKDDLFFGFRRKEPATSTHTILNQIDHLLKNVDLEMLMETIDMFVTTSKQFKPLLKEIPPFLHRFSKRFKSNE